MHRKVQENGFKHLLKTELMQEVNKAVTEIKNNEEKEAAYMTYMMKLDDVRGEGRQEGRQEGLREAVRAFAKTGTPLSQIAETLHLSLEEVKKMVSDP